MDRCPCRSWLPAIEPTLPPPFTSPQTPSGLHLTVLFCPCCPQHLSPAQKTYSPITPFRQDLLTIHPPTPSPNIHQSSTICLTNSPLDPPFPPTNTLLTPALPRIKHAQLGVIVTLHFLSNPLYNLASVTTPNHLWIPGINHPLYHLLIRLILVGGYGNKVTGTLQ